MNKVNRGRDGERGRSGGPAPALLPLPLLALCLGAVSVLAALSPAITERLQYDRAAIAAGEVWRLVTGHWTHWNVDHLIWDAAVFTALGAFCEMRSRRLFLLSTVAAAPAISAVLWAALPEMQHYRGLSGLDAALYMAAGLLVVIEGDSAPSAKRAAGATALVAAFLGKIGYEALTGSTFFVQDSGGFVPVPVAHVAGALLGAAAWILARCFPAPGGDLTCRPRRTIPSRSTGSRGIGPRRPFASPRTPG